MGVEENMDWDPSELLPLMRYHVHHEFIQRLQRLSHTTFRFIVLVERGLDTEFHSEDLDLGRSSAAIVMKATKPVIENIYCPKSQLQSERSDLESPQLNLDGRATINRLDI